jgi:folate-binding protein YgfZ
MDSTRRVFADRSERGKVRFIGPQRAWFLHQILTQALEDITEGEARDAAMITSHGRMLGYLEIVATEDTLLAHFEPELLETLPEEMTRYVFATQVEIADVTSDYGLVLVAGDDWRDIAGRVAPDSIAQRTLSLGVPAGYLWTRRDSVDDAVAGLKGEGYEHASENELEAMRVERGMARWGHDMTTRTLPPEANLDDVAVHYDKGCYLGQETMAKIKFRGHVNRTLRRLELDGAAAPGDEVGLEDAKAGVVTSVAGDRAFAMLRHNIEPGTAVTIGESRATVIE